MIVRYSVQVYSVGKWREVFCESSRAYCLGYLERLRDQGGPRSAWRLLDTQTQKVIREIDAIDSVNVGVFVGQPTAEQYERAARDALERAAVIRKREQSDG